MKELLKGIFILLLIPIIIILRLLDEIRNIGSNDFNELSIDEYWSNKFFNKIIGEQK
jgi:inner membrane protein involved in colicin E2 resistance